MHGKIHSSSLLSKAVEAEVCGRMPETEVGGVNLVWTLDLDLDQIRLNEPKAATVEMD